MYELHNSDSPPGKDCRLDGSNDDGSKSKLEGLNFSGNPKGPGSWPKHWTESKSSNAAGVNVKLCIVDPKYTCYGDDECSCGTTGAVSAALINFGLSKNAFPNLCRSDY